MHQTSAGTKKTKKQKFQQLLRSNETCKTRYVPTSWVVTFPPSFSSRVLDVLVLYPPI